jgi:hypothetical protein
VRRAVYWYGGVISGVCLCMCVRAYVYVCCVYMRVCVCMSSATGKVCWTEYPSSIPVYLFRPKLRPLL